MQFKLLKTVDFIKQLSVYKIIDRLLSQSDNKLSMFVGQNPLLNDTRHPEGHTRP